MCVELMLRHALWCLRIRLARQSRVSRFRVWSHECILPSLKPHMTRREAVCLQGNYRVYQCQHNIYPIKHSIFLHLQTTTIYHYHHSTTTHRQHVWISVQPRLLSPHPHALCIRLPKLYSPKPDYVPPSTYIRRASPAPPYAASTSPTTVPLPSPPTRPFCQTPLTLLRHLPQPLRT